MITKVKRFKVEVLADAPLLPLVEEVAHRAGVRGYTVLPTIGGEGRAGRWEEDQVSGAQVKVMFVSIMSHERSEVLIDLLSPHLETYGFVVARTEVEVVRGERF